MDKNNFLNRNLLSKTNIALVCIFGMFIGFLCSHALLSFFTVIFGLNALWKIHPRHWLKQKWWLTGVLWILFCALTWFWTADKGSWASQMQEKMPVMLLPLAFAFLPSVSRRQVNVFTAGVAIIMLSGIMYSVVSVLGDLDYYVHRYLQSQIFPTPVDGDHIRFSLSLALFIIWCTYAWPMLSKGIKWFIALVILVFTAYLHVLAVRSGLAVFYLSLFTLAIYIGLKRNKILGLGILVVLALGFLALVRYVPTLNKRVGYSYYTYQQYKDGNISADYSDIGRFMSYDVAGELIKVYPVAGVGIGDIMPEMRTGYSKRYPQVPDDRILIPHNQFLTLLVGTGIIGCLFFCVWVFFPLSYLKKDRESFFFFVVWLSLFMSMMVEAMLQVQDGLFVYLFFLLWQWHFLRKPVQD